MNQNNRKKLLLLVGLGVGGFTILAAGHQMVEALEASSALQGERSSVSPVPTDPLLSLLEQSPAFQPSDLSPGFGSGSTSTNQSRYLEGSGDAASGSLTSSDRNLLAINAGSADDPQQPVSQISPTQIAANEWYGASFPVEGFQSYTSPFGYRSSPDGGYSTEFHYGLDMAAPEGSYIRNWWSGQVVEVSDDSNCGTSVVVESGEWTHIYCHLQGHVESDEKGRYMIDREGGVQIWEGQEVTAGMRMGRVGMTGRTTGPHLHWGLKYEGSWVDPALVLRAMYVSQQAAVQSDGVQ